MENKKCPKCNLILSISLFGKNKAKKDGLQVHCNECRKNINNTQYASNPKRKEAVRRNQKISYERARNLINSVKRSNSCRICGESEVCALDFHHVSDEKEYGISEMAGNTSLEKLQREIDKCVVVCANCHRKIHAGILSL